MAMAKRSRGKTELKAGRDALVVVDAINDLEFEGGEKVLPWAIRLAGRLVKFRAKARRAGVPVIYVNDNYGLWRSSVAEVLAHCMRRGARGRKLCRRVRPGRSDYFLFKPRHSGFFGTALESLLQELGVQRLILAGVATNLCVLFTAHDAHMLGYEMVVLSDCCAAESDADHDLALEQLERFCGARICGSWEFENGPTKPRRRQDSRKEKRTNEGGRR